MYIPQTITMPDNIQPDIIICETQKKFKSKGRITEFFIDPFHFKKTEAINKKQKEDNPASSDEELGHEVKILNGNLVN